MSNVDRTDLGRAAVFGMKAGEKTAGAGIPLVAFTLVLVFLLLGGCSSRAALELDDDRSGAARVVVDLDPVFVSYFRDLSGSIGAGEDTPVFDLPAIRARFDQEPALILEQARLPAQGRLELTFTFIDLTTLAADDRLTRILDFEPSGDSGGVLTIRLTRGEVPYLLSLAGLDEGSPIEYLLPPTGGEMSSEEYRDYLTWALEEYASPGRLRRVLDSAALIVTVETPQPLDRVVNGSRPEASRATFRIPLLGLLTGETEEEYRLTY